MEDTLMAILNLLGTFSWGLIANILCQSIINHSSAIFDHAISPPSSLPRSRTSHRTINGGEMAHHHHHHHHHNHHYQQQQQQQPPSP
ncbi:hypothetical protein M0802_009755 [Mischocyttarus mexicanus]|nr:hypothetical protein M0802_009755 [Mischocyttarus mexicanus]